MEYKKKIYNLGILIFIAIAFFHFVSAVPPFQSSPQTAIKEYIIEYPKFDYVKANTDYNFYASVYYDNGSELLNINASIVNCTLAGFGMQGQLLAYTQLNYNSTINMFDEVFPSELFTDGKGYYKVSCTDINNVTGFVSNPFVVNNGGFELDTGTSIAYIGLIFFLFALFILSLVGTFRVKNFITQFIFFWVTFLLFFAITFVSYQLTNSYFLQVEFLGTFFWILYWIMLIGTIPLFFSSMAYLFYIVTYNDHFKKLVEKGMSMEEAFKYNERNLNPFRSGRR